MTVSSQAKQTAVTGRTGSSRLLVTAFYQNPWISAGTLADLVLNHNIFLFYHMAI